MISVSLWLTHIQIIWWAEAVLPKYSNDHSDLHPVDSEEGKGEGGVCLNTAQIAFLCIPMLPEKPSLSPKGKCSHQALRRTLYKYKFLILLFTEEKKGHFLCPLQWISCRKAVKKAICKRPLCLSPCLKDLAFLFLSDEAHCYLWWI